MNVISGGPNNNGLNSSQIVRQGLRAVVSGRTQQSNVGNNNTSNNNNSIRRNLASPLDPLGPNGSGALIDNNTNNSNPNSNLIINQQQLQGNLLNSSSDLDPSMRFNFDMPQGEITK